MKIVAGVLLVILAYWLATRKKSGNAGPGGGPVTKIDFTDEEAGTITVEAHASSLTMRKFPAPLPAGTLGNMPHRTGDEL